MKKITKIAATFAAAMAIFFGASCSHDGGASLATLGGGGGSTTTTDPVVVDAVWSFATQPTGFPLTDTENDAITAFKLSPTSGSGATLTATGRWKWDKEYLQAQSSSGKTVSEAAGWTSTSSGKFLTLTLEGDANVTVEYSGSGALANTRWVAILDGDNMVKFSTPAGGIGSDSKDTKTLPLTKGTYTIAANAARIYSVTCAQEKKDPGNEGEGEGEGDEGEGDGEEESKIEVETKNVYTEYFDGKANIYIDSTFSGIFAGGVLGTDSANGKKTTYEFTSGVKWVPGTGGKIDSKSLSIGSYTSKFCLSLDKPANNAPMTVPVNGACTVVLGFQNNKDSRGFTVESTDATISNEKVEHYSTDQTDGTVSVSGGKTLTYEVTGKSNNELISFDVDAADTLTIKTTDGTSSGTVYIYFVDVKAKE